MVRGALSTILPVISKVETMLCLQTAFEELAKALGVEKEGKRRGRILRRGDIVFRLPSPLAHCEAIGRWGFAALVGLF